MQTFVLFTKFSRGKIVACNKSHIQLLLGLGLYMISPKVHAVGESVMKEPVARFFAVEHLAMMIIGQVTKPV